MAADSDHVHAVSVAQFQFADGLSHPGRNRFHLHDAEFLAQLDVFHNAGVGQAQGQLVRDLPLRDDHLIRAQFLQDTLVGIIMGFAHDIRNVQALQVHGDQGGSRQVGTYRDDGAVEVLHAQLLQHVRVPGVRRDGAGYPVGDLIDQLLVRINGHDLFPAGIEPGRQLRAETAQADYNIGLHQTFPPVIRSADRYSRICISPRMACPAGSPC